jgi:hypothetical protein
VSKPLYSTATIPPAVIEGLVQEETQVNVTVTVSLCPTPLPMMFAA